MNIHFKQLLLLAAVTLTFIACDEDDGGENIDTTQKFVSEETQAGNQINNGFAAGDKDAIYFYHFDDEGIKLYRKDRQTGLSTVLDEITRLRDGVDLLYTGVQIIGDYLYYMPCDANDEDRLNRIWRMKKDGTEKELVVSHNVYYYRIYNDKIYFSVLMGEDGFYSCNLDGTDVQKILDECPSSPYFRDGKVYYCDYTHEGGFHTQICVKDMNSSAEPEVLFDSQNSLAYVFAENGMLYCTDVLSTSSCNLVRINPITKESEILIKKIPFGRLNTSGNTIFIACGESNANYQAGIYRYEDGYEVLVPILKVATYNTFLVGNDQIVYANENDKENAGRFCQLYLTDFKGSFNKRVIE